MYCYILDNNVTSLQVMKFLDSEPTQLYIISEISEIVIYSTKKAYKWKNKLRAVSEKWA